MNTRHLANLYDMLHPRERLSLIMAAGARGDALEQKRLAGSAPTRSFEVPDYYPLAKAFQEAVNYHLLTLLDLAASFWQWWGLWMTYPLRGKPSPMRSNPGAREPWTTG